jgi:hypothetical protein
VVKRHNQLPHVHNKLPTAHLMGVAGCRMDKLNKQVGSSFFLAGYYSGVYNHISSYSNPPVEVTDFAAAIEAYHKADAELTQAIVAKKLAAVNKLQATEALTKMMKRQLRYAEYITDFDEPKLKLLGWGAVKKRHQEQRPRSQQMPKKRWIIFKMMAYLSQMRACQSLMRAYPLLTRAYLPLIRPYIPLIRRHESAF